MAVSYTPMMKQYQEIKSQHPDEILFFRLGDFYEMFFEDAETASRELEITLTSRDGGQSTRVPMCGIPYHAADNYISRLIHKGYKVAICEQVEDPKSAKGIVRREVIRVITPGTVIAESLLSDKGNNFLIVIYEQSDNLAMAATDISTGECLWAMFSGQDRLTALCDQLFRLMPSELAIVETVDNVDVLDDFLEKRVPCCTKTFIKLDHLQQIIELPARYFADNELPDDNCATIAVGCLLCYLNSTVKADLSYLNRLTKHNASEYLIIDTSALRNLEITRNMRDGGKKDTVLSVLDFTKTAMGSRLLKRWLEYPLIKHAQIVSRQNAIAELAAKPSVRQLLQECLAGIYDFERIITRIEVGTANARDLVALKASLRMLPDIKAILHSSNDYYLKTIDADMNPHTDIVDKIEVSIVDNPPLVIREGGMIKSGFNEELDEVRNIANDSKKWVQDLESRERELIGIRSLKVGYNKVFGYYIEVTHTHTGSVPDHYVRKQTLANAERYITPELKEFESKILGAQERIVNLEYHLFSQVRDFVRNYVKVIQQSAKQIGRLDSIVSLAEAAVRYNYTRPTITNDRRIIIKDGRHPIIERILSREMFVPNDVVLNHSDSEIIVITGPNMAGKSTYMRQVALLVLMAQIGSFVPAREACISPVDQIFTRVGASDDLATGQSTFMVEMNEVAHILKHATADSLIILDEIGRGTSTFDGMSIARSVIEFIKDRIKAKTLFATHYHELTELAECHEGIKNFSIAVKERGSDIIFLRRIVPGGADKSYGIHVAHLAGLPRRVIERAKKLLSEMEQDGIKNQGSQVAATTTNAQSLSLFEQPIIDELLVLDIMTLSPIEALNILYRLQNQAKKEAGKLI